VEKSEWVVDYVSLIIFVTAYIMTMVRSIPLRLRNAAFGLGLVGIGGYRIVLLGTSGFNFAISLSAFFIAAFYILRAIRGDRR